MVDPPPESCSPLTELLSVTSHTYPQVFFKPIFACAAASKELPAVNHLWSLVMLARHMPDFWTRDAEMMSVALAGDGRRAKDGDPQSATPPSRGTAKLGQGILLMELIAKAQAVRKAAELSNVSPRP